MTNETMKDGEQAAFEAWWEAKCRLFVVHESQKVPAWLAWQARAASPQSGGATTD